MSELKLYVVKNDEGKYWDFSDNDIFWSLAATRCPTTSGRNLATSTANEHGGHVVTLVEEPEKVVLSEKQAKIVEGANKSQFPASYISDHTGSSYCLEKLLMDAYANGYTMEKEKKYNIKVPHLPLYYWKKPDGGIGGDDLNAADDDDTDDFEFTESEIEHYGLQDCERIGI
ncbi:DUF1642 domain-containing protein [Lacticaseibacillus paracasei]|uniref:DUF1642 domain-containing protein n=1 Tax=Lacticaseibacillus paracasei TaxID=1597 RepID=UPI0005178E9A|nr:DUF1642 domain-containing protein [Lacticaseibacillus paracasei]